MNIGDIRQEKIGDCALCTRFYSANTACIGMGLALFVIISFSGSARADDVEFGFAAGMGGTGIDEGHGIAVDALGNVYTTGRFSGTVDFNPGVGTANRTSAGSFDIYIQKLNSAGSLVWVRRIGGTGADGGLGIAVDASGNVYTTGYFKATVDFEPGMGTSNLISVNKEDIFVSKLDSAGNFVWARAMGGTGSDRGIGIAVDSSGNAHTTGYFWNTVDFDPGGGTFNLTSAGNQDIFVNKLDSAGNFVWAGRLGGILHIDEGFGIAVDSVGNVFTTGSFWQTVDFDPGAGTFEITNNSLGADTFILKLNSAGNFIWAKAFAGMDWVTGRGIALDSSGNVYTTGGFRNTADFDPGLGTFNLTTANGFETFVSKLDSDGNFIWAGTMVGGGHNEGFAIAVDSCGNVYTTGSFSNTTDFDPGVGTFNLTAAGLGDIFVSRLDSAGNFLWAKAMGSSSEFDKGLGIALDAAGSVYTTGLFGGTADFDPGSSTVNLTGEGLSDIFVSKLTGIRNLVEAWVDFGFDGIGCGSEENPFNLLAEGLAGVDESGTVKIKGNTGDNASSETMTIDQAVTLEAVNGTVRIGDAGSRISDRVGQAGFVSRD